MSFGKELECLRRVLGLSERLKDRQKGPEVRAMHACAYVPYVLLLFRVGYAR